MTTRSIAQSSQGQFPQQEEKQTMHKKCSISIEINKIASSRNNDQYSE